MKDTDLLLTEKERNAAWNRGITGGSVWPEDGIKAVAEAQAAKVLAELRVYFVDADFASRHLRSIVAETGLTWPPKEEG